MILISKQNLLFLILICFCFTNTYAQQKPIDWVDEHAVAIANDDKSLPAIAAQLKGNAIVGLGEASHGTHEFSTEKNRIIKYLISRDGYKAIGFEFGYSRMAAINIYIQSGKGDLKQLMAPLRLFDTQEIYDLFQSLKVYNDGRPAKDKVTLFGFDIDFTKADNDSSANYCINYLAKNTIYKNGPKAITALKNITNPGIEHLYDLYSSDVGAITDLYKEIFATNNSNDKEFVEFKKRLSLLYQGTLVTDPLARDKFMAGNIAGIQKASQEKTIIWSHNIHIAKDTVMTQCRNMGYYLRQNYGDKYYAIGFDTFKGKVTLLNDDTFEQHDFQTPANSFSAMFATAKYPAFFIPFTNAPGNPLYNVTGTITNIYANWTGNLTLQMRPGKEFDGVIFIRETTASEVLK